MKLNEIRDNEGAHKRFRRIGRGSGSGKGKTAGRGVKGQKARTATTACSGSKAARCRRTCAFPSVASTISSRVALRSLTPPAAESHGKRQDQGWRYAERREACGLALLTSPRTAFASLEKAT